MKIFFSKKEMSATYPVWIGSLAPDVQETHLLETFNSYGPIASVRVIRDGSGRSKKFGFINFHSLRQAEMAAEFGQRALVNGRQVVVKGPQELQKDGHYKSSMDYRPLTDCLFFMEKGGCSNRDSVSDLGQWDVVSSTRCSCVSNASVEP